MIRTGGFFNKAEVGRDQRTSGWEDGKKRGSHGVQLHLEFIKSARRNGVHWFLNVSRVAQGTVTRLLLEPMSALRVRLPNGIFEPRVSFPPPSRGVAAPNAVMLVAPSRERALQFTISRYTVHEMCLGKCLN